MRKDATGRGGFDAAGCVAGGGTGLLDANELTARDAGRVRR